MYMGYLGDGRVKVLNECFPEFLAYSNFRLFLSLRLHLTLLPLVFCVFTSLLLTVHGFLDRVHVCLCLLGGSLSIRVPYGVPLMRRRMGASTGRVPTYSEGTNGAWEENKGCFLKTHKVQHKKLSLRRKK